jgi:hypothetical protein
MKKADDYSVINSNTPLLLLHHTDSRQEWHNVGYICDVHGHRILEFANVISPDVNLCQTHFL